MEQINWKKGLSIGVLTYIIWGFLPIYWKLLDDVHAWTVLTHRIIWSFVFILLYILFTNQFQVFIYEVKQIWKNKRDMLIIIAASIFITINWLLFIWAVLSDYVVETSLGYYINPLVSVVFGVIFFKEKLTPVQKLAVIIAAVGVGYLTLSYGVFPWVSLTLATSFGLYGVLKKFLHIKSIFSLAMETLIMFPIALIYLFVTFGPTIGFGNETVTTSLLLLASGIATAVPLLLFGTAVQYIPLSIVGFLQYIAPTMILIFGVYLYNEPFTINHFITFSLIWLSIVLFMTSTYKSRKKEQHAH